MLLKKVFELIYSILNIILLNIYILIQKFQKKTVILFYHPKKNLTKIHNFYLKDIAKKNKLYTVIFCSKKIAFENFYIKEKLLNYIFFSDIFLSNNVSDNFTRQSHKVYMHHDIYDTPLVGKTVEYNLKKRLEKYDVIILPSKKSDPVFKRILKSMKNKPAVLYSYNYPKLNYLLKKINVTKKKFKTIIIAPTNFNSFKGLVISKYLQETILKLLKLNFNVIYRPHPSNLEDKRVKKIYEKVLNYKNFLLDNSENYLKTYNSSNIMITDLSGTAYTYALLTKNPVMFFSPGEKLIKNSYYQKLNYFKDRGKIGKVFLNIKQLLNFFENDKKKIKLKMYEKNINKIYKDNFFNKKNIFDIIYNNFKIMSK